MYMAVSCLSFLSRINILCMIVSYMIVVYHAEEINLLIVDVFHSMNIDFEFYMLNVNVNVNVNVNFICQTMNNHYYISISQSA